MAGFMGLREETLNVGKFVFNLWISLVVWAHTSGLVYRRSWSGQISFHVLFFIVKISFLFVYMSILKVEVMSMEYDNTHYKKSILTEKEW